MSWPKLTGGRVEFVCNYPKGNVNSSLRSKQLSKSPTQLIFRLSPHSENFFYTSERVELYDKSVAREEKVVCSGRRSSSRSPKKKTSPVLLLLLLIERFTILPLLAHTTFARLIFMIFLLSLRGHKKRGKARWAQQENSKRKREKWRKSVLLWLRAVKSFAIHFDVCSTSPLPLPALQSLKCQQLMINTNYRHPDDFHQHELHPQGCNRATREECEVRLSHYKARSAELMIQEDQRRDLPNGTLFRSQGEKKKTRKSIIEHHPMFSLKFRCLLPNNLNRLKKGFALRSAKKPATKRASHKNRSHRLLNEAVTLTSVCSWNEEEGKSAKCLSPQSFSVFLFVLSKLLNVGRGEEIWANELESLSW